MALDGTAVTGTGTVLGSPGFMSPEQAEGGQVGPASDVFALGCVLAYAATGAAPFGVGSPVVVQYRVVHGEPALGDMSGPLRDLVAGCLAKDPAGRPALAELLQALAGHRVPGEAAFPESFWPEPLAGLIRSRQAPPGMSRPGQAPLPAGSIVNDQATRDRTGGLVRVPVPRPRRPRRSPLRNPGVIAAAHRRQGHLRCSGERREGSRSAAGHADEHGLAIREPARRGRAGQTRDNDRGLGGAVQLQRLTPSCAGTTPG